MYRVAKIAVLAIEPYDSLLSRLSVRLRFGQTYEHAAVYCNECVKGGVMNTAIPNFVYRWTEAEVSKTIHSFEPRFQDEIRFFHDVQIPWEQLKHRKNPLWHYSGLAMSPILSSTANIFSCLCNILGFFIKKKRASKDTLPWLCQDDKGEITLNEDWFKTRY
jgi:hypothetical protein